jgi:ketosteroid isomerase-like protein
MNPRCAFRSLCLPAALLFSLAGLPSPAAAQTASAGETQVRHWLDDFQKAFAARDTEATMKLYAPDVIAYDITPPLQYVGKDAYTKDFATYYAGYKNLAIEVRDVHIYVEGNLAIIACLEHVSGTLNSGQATSMWLRTTSGLRKVNGKWLDFHDHVSVPTDFDTGKSLTDLKP